MNPNEGEHLPHPLLFAQRPAPEQPPLERPITLESLHQTQRQTYFFTPIGSVGAKILANTVIEPYSQLTALLMPSHAIGDLGISYLAEAISHPQCQLKQLNCDHNLISDQGAQLLAIAAVQAEHQRGKNCIQISIKPLQFHRYLMHARQQYQQLNAAKTPLRWEWCSVFFMLMAFSFSLWVSLQSRPVTASFKS